MPSDTVLKPVALVVEDDPASKTVMVEALKLFGLDVDTASNGAEAMACLAAKPYAIVFMDSHMPVMGGIECCHRIRLAETADGLGDHVPIIATTASGMPDELQACLDAGMDGSILKPLDFRQLNRLVATWVHPPTP